MKNDDSFFDLELGDNFSRHLRKFSEITDKKEAAAALDEQILAYRDEARSVSWAKAVIDLREEVMSGYTELLVFSKEKDTLVALYNEANAYLEKLSADKINRVKAELEKLEKAKRTMAWCGKVKDLWGEVTDWTKAEQASLGCKARLEELMAEFDGIEQADQLDDKVAKLEKAKKKDESWCDEVDALAPAFKSTYAKYATCENAYRALQKLAVDVRREPIVQSYKDFIASALQKSMNDTLCRQFRKLDKEKAELEFTLTDYISDFDLSWEKVKDKVDSFEKDQKAAADHHANLRQTFKQFLYREEEDGSIFIGRYKGSDSVVTLPEGVREIGASAFAGNDSVTELNLPDSLEIIGEGAFSDCTSLAFVTFGAGLVKVEAEAFYACTALTAVSLPRSVQWVGDRAFAKCKKLGRFSPLSSKCKVGEDYLMDTLYLKRRAEEELREAEEALEAEAKKVDDKIQSLANMDRGKMWLKLLKQVREEVSGLSTSVSVKLRSISLLEHMEAEAERFAEDGRLDAQIENLSDESRTPSWCKKVESLYETVTKGEHNCANRALLEKLYKECIQLEKDLKQAEQDEQARQARLADEAATAEAKAVDDKILGAKSMTRNSAWEQRLKEARSEVKKLSADARKKLLHLSLLEEMEAEAQQLADAAAEAQAAKVNAARAKKERREKIKKFFAETWLFMIALAVAGIGVIFMKRWFSPILTGLGAGMFFLVLTLKLDGELDRETRSIYRLVLFFLGLGGMIALCCVSRYWTIFSVILSVGFAVSYIVIAATDDYDVSFESFGVVAATILSITTVSLFIALCAAWGFKDYVIKDGVLKGYNVRGETVVTLPDGITVIGNGAFYDKNKIEKVILPSSVTEIQSNAFGDCDNLKAVEYGDHVKEIAADAFKGDTFDSLYIPANVTKLDFLNNLKVDTVTISPENETFHMVGNAIIKTAENRLFKADNDGVIPEGVTSIAPYAFFNVSSEAKVVIPSGIETIEAYAFSGANVASITVGGDVKAIEAYAFNECTVTKLVILTNVQSIERGALERCWVENLTVPFIGIVSNATDGYFGDIFGSGGGNSSTYKDYAGNRIPDTLKKVTVLSGNVFKNSFNKVKKVEEVVLLGAKRIEYQGFYNCDELSKLYVTTDLEYLGECLFLTGEKTVLTILYEGTEAEWNQIETYNPASALNFKWDYGREIHRSYEQPLPRQE